MSFGGVALIKQRCPLTRAKTNWLTTVSFAVFDGRKKMSEKANWVLPEMFFLFAGQNPVSLHQNSKTNQLHRIRTKTQKYKRLLKQTKKQLHVLLAVSYLKIEIFESVFSLSCVSGAWLWG